jgi:hypothetical protein
LSSFYSGKGAEAIPWFFYLSGAGLWLGKAQAGSLRYYGQSFWAGVIEFCGA